VPEGRIASVTGRADKELFVPDDPFSPRNRRISITVLYDAPSGGPR
jgi:chemotaxis protein MotB